MTVVARHIKFFAGGEAVGRYGVLVKRTAIGEDYPETYARTGTAPYFDEDGFVRVAEANTPRASWRDLDGDGVPETPVLPIQGAQTNVVDFNIPSGVSFPEIAGEGGPIGIAGAAIVTAASQGIDLPYDSSLGANIIKLTSGTAGSGTRRYRFGLAGQLNGFTADTLSGMVVGVFIPTSSEIAAGQVRAYAVDDQGSSAGDVCPAKNRWCWLWATRTWDAIASEAYYELRFADGATLAGADEVVYMALPTIVSGAVPLCAIPQADAVGVSVAADTFYSGYEEPPKACGLYAKWKAWGAGGILYIGAAGATGARLWVEQDANGNVAVRYSDGSTTVASLLSVTVTPGQTVQCYGAVTAGGVITAYLRVNGGAIQTASASAALDLPSDWGAKRVYVGSLGGGSQATAEILAAKVVIGAAYSLDEAEAAA